MSERLVRMLRGRVAPPVGVTDADLLTRWSAQRDEAAFELLLRRHAEPVWRTCVAVAGSHPAAEDAFQATFLALARRAGAVRANVPGFLHRVARHAALKARRAGSVSDRSATATARDAPVAGGRFLRSLTLPARPDADDLATLHAELARLPDAYRVPVLLCHLHGLTQAQAAKELGLPLGTVATRVRRGCDRLRTALTRRGLAPALNFGPPLAIPAGLLPAALGVGLGATAAPPAIHSLANGALSAMSRTKLKLLAAVAAAGTALTGGALVARHPAADPQPPALPPPAPAAAKWEPKPADFFDRRSSMDHLKRVMLAVYNFENVNGKLPGDIVGKDGTPLLSWRVAVLPYIDQELLYGMFKLDEPWDGPTNRPLMKHVPKVFRSAGAAAGQTRVKMFRGPDAALDPAGNRKFEDFRDGSSNTVGAVDAGAAVEWTKPGDLGYAKDKPLPDLTGPFTDGFAAGYMDGSVRWHRRNLPEKLLRLLIERDDGTAIVEPDLPPLPKRPLTEREKKQADQWRRNLADSRSWAEVASEERIAATLALAKLGPIPLPEPPAGDDLWKLEQAVNEQWQRSSVDRNEAERLLELLAAKDKPAADKLRKEFDARRRKHLEEQQKKLEQKKN